MKLMNLLEKHHITVTDIAKQCDVATSQIYYWNKHGISKHNPHFETLKQIIPELKAKEITIKQNGEEDRRYKSGRKQNELKLSNTDTLHKQTKVPTSTLFPKISIKKKGS